MIVMQDPASSVAERGWALGILSEWKKVPLSSNRRREILLDKSHQLSRGRLLRLRDLKSVLAMATKVSVDTIFRFERADNDAIGGSLTSIDMGASYVW
jgi:hypothetical protein